MKIKIIITAVVIALSLFFLSSHVIEGATPMVATSTVSDSRVTILDSYFKKHHMPLAGYGKEFVAVADENHIDWRLLPAIAVRESSGGLHECGKNAWGWASCKKTFTSYSEGIETIGRVLGTSKTYKGKTIRQVLNIYNPPSIMPGYASSVIAIMQSLK